MLDLNKYYKYSTTDTEFCNDLNKSGYEVSDSVEGCCSDNYLINTEKGIIVAFEHYLNEWCSDLRIYFQKYPANELYEIWDDFVKTYEETYEE